jgi:hypothetical protein
MVFMVQGPRPLPAPPPAHGFGGLEGIRTGRQGMLYRFRKGMGFAQPFHASIYSTRSGLGFQHEVLQSKTTSLSVY